MSTGATSSTDSERHYVHRVPGRIRVRSCRLREPSRLAQAERLVMAIVGVHRVHAQPLTGSLLIHHDPALLDGVEIARLLADARLLDLESAARGRGRIDELAEQVAQHAYEAATRNLLPRAAASLFAVFV